MRLKHLQKLVRINVLRRQQYLNRATFYASYVLNRAVALLFFHRGNPSCKALTHLAGGRINEAAAIIKKIKPEIGILLEAHQNLAAVYPRILRQIKSNRPYIVFSLLTANLMFDETKFFALMPKIKINKLSAKTKAYYLYTSAFGYLREADMMSASQNASAALDLFKKSGYLFEEAQCYLLLAEIYRISCVNDIAQTMIESAIKIYRLQKLKLFEAQATAILGMLMLYENRIEEAEDKYIKALRLADTDKVCAEIYNQYALLDLAQKNMESAFKKARRAFNLHRKINNERGQAFSKQLIAHIYIDKQQHTKAAAAAEYAAKLYFAQSNYSAFAECLYLKARALCELEDYKKSEILLRQILDLHKNNSLNFHVANAYSLLGLIYIQTRDFQRAKVLFQQSLQLEQSNERCNGLVADYANLAVVETCYGNTDAARNNLQTALEFAQKTEDEELIKLITEKISPPINN